MIESVCQLVNFRNRDSIDLAVYNKHVTNRLSSNFKVMSIASSPKGYGQLDDLICTSTDTSANNLSDINDDFKNLVGNVSENIITEITALHEATLNDKTLFIGEKTMINKIPTLPVETKLALSYFKSNTSSINLDSVCVIDKEMVTDFINSAVAEILDTYNKVGKVNSNAFITILNRFVRSNDVFFFVDNSIKVM